MANEGKYLNLKPHVTSWSIYNINGPYVTSSRIGTVAPSQFGGLSYQILEDKGNYIYIIQTESFGRVAIWAGDSDSTITDSPAYTNGASAPTGGTGLYVNLKPHVQSWSIYNPNGPYVTSSRIGTLAPAQFGGLSYEIQGEKGNDVYLIQTESFGLVAIWAGDSDSTFTSVPTYLDPVNGGQGGGGTAGTGQYLNLHPHVTSWSIYNVNGPYVSSSRIGTLAPAQYGGLSYAILGSPAADVYLIQTESFGQVAIWAGDSDSSITGSPLYAAGSFTGSVEGTAGGTYVNLSPTVDSWSIYHVNGPYITSSRIGTLAPSQFGGLSYRILESKGNHVYIIQTESFGKVAIWAGDSDSTFTNYPTYGGASATPSPGGSLGGIDFTNLPVSIQPRSTWGAAPIQWGGMDDKLGTVKYIVIHHTAGAQPQVGSDQEVMRGIQNYHQSLGWGDIGYHFCIGQRGTVMEGRPMPYVGAHVGRPHNFDSIGVSLFGDFSYVRPGDVQLDKLVRLLKYLCDRYNISPDNILGHRDMDSHYGPTACPGSYFYNWTNRLQDIRNAVKKLFLEEDSLSISEKEDQILEHIENTFEGLPFFKDVPFDTTMWDNEKVIPVSPNMRLKVKLTMEGDSDSYLSDLFSVNFTTPEIQLEGPFFDLLREKKLDDVEFYKSIETMEQLVENLNNVGNVTLSMGYHGGRNQFLFNFVVNFNSVPLSDGTSLKSSCRITIGIDNGTFFTPAPENKEILNEQYVNAINTAILYVLGGLLIIKLAPALAGVAAGAGITTTAITLLALMISEEQ